MSRAIPLLARGALKACSRVNFILPLRCSIKSRLRLTNSLCSVFTFHQQPVVSLCDDIHKPLVCRFSITEHKSVNSIKKVIF
jgi:hypothetical protein